MVARLRKVKPGEKLKDGGLSAGTWNEFIDAVDWIRNFKHQQIPKPREYRDGIVQALNNTAYDFSQFNIVGLDTILFSPTDNLSEFKNNYAFKAGVYSTATHDGDNWGIIQQPLATGSKSPGSVRLAGTSICKINMTDATHRYAKPSDGDLEMLVSSASEGVPILYVDGTTGSGLWAVVLLDRTIPIASWGRTVSVSGAYPDFSDVSLTRETPIYTVELSTLQVPAGDTQFSQTTEGISLTSTGVVDASRYSASNYPVTFTGSTIKAASAIGDLHEGSWVYCLSIKGSWFIIGPQSHAYSRVSTSLVKGSTNLPAAQGFAKGTEKLYLLPIALLGTGSDYIHAGAGNSTGYDVTWLDPYSDHTQPTLQFNRRGDYLISISVPVGPANFSYMSGSLDSSEQYTKATYTTTSTTGHTHNVVDVTSPLMASWTVNLKIGTTNTATVTDAKTLGVVSIFYHNIGAHTLTVSVVLSFQKGDKINLWLENDSTEYHTNGGSIAYRGFTLFNSGAGSIDIARLGQPQSNTLR